jgi:pyridoxine/pyridoxamine 5'-phosphate oxidase
MTEPQARRPYWPDAVQNPAGPAKDLKSWSWALKRLDKSHNYWISTARPDGRPHLMVVWGIWIEDAFWFCTGARTRKSKNLLAHPQCVIATEAADEAVILEGEVAQVLDKIQLEGFVTAYNKKYGGDVEALLKDQSSLVYRVNPSKVFGFDEHAENFVESATRWDFPKP